MCCHRELFLTEKRCTNFRSHSVFFSIGLPADELVVFDVHRERAARGDIAGEDGSRQQRFHAALEIPAQRTRAVERIVAALDDKLLRLVGDAELE